MADKVWFRIGYTCSCVARSLPVVEQWAIWEGVLVESVDIFQLGHRTSVEASKGTHARGGCTDTGNVSDAMEDIWRMFGWTMQKRYLKGVDEHFHGWPYGCPHLSPAAQLQADDWDRRDAGLVGTARVGGRYPVERWDVALERMERRMAQRLEDFKDDVIRGVVAELRPDIRAVPENVWSSKTVDIIDNDAITGNVKNTDVTPVTWANAVWDAVRDTRAAVRALGKA